MRQAPLAIVRWTLPCALLSSALVAHASAQYQTWIRQFGTTAADYAQALAPDGAGGVYVSGRLVRNTGGAWVSDAWLARYDRAGDEVWVRRFVTGESDEVTGLAPDGAGGVFACGWSEGSLGSANAGGRDAWLAHLDGAGGVHWILQFGTVEDDSASSVASDGAGGVVVLGDTWGALGGPSAGLQDLWLARFAGAGSQAWIRQLGTAGLERAAAVTDDGAQGAFVCGRTNGSLAAPNMGSSDVWIARYDGAGNQLWSDQFGTTVIEYPFAIAPDGAGGVFVGGLATGSLFASQFGEVDAWLARYDGAGSQVWTRQFGTNHVDVVNALAADGAGGVYVTGFTEGALGGPTAGLADVWLARFDGNGIQTWIRKFGSNVVDVAEAAAPDGAGDVYLCGWTFGDLGGPNAGAVDAWVSHYDGLVSTHYCASATANSTGAVGRIDVGGELEVAANDVTLFASRLPQGAFGFFLTSLTQGLAPHPGASRGHLCLAGAIGRFVGAGQVQFSGSAGAFSLAIDLTSLPQPLGSVTVQPGESWNFQAWHRDANPTSTSNFTDAVSVRFR